MLIKSCIVVHVVLIDTSSFRRYSDQPTARWPYWNGDKNRPCKADVTTLDQGRPSGSGSMAVYSI